MSAQKNSVLSDQARSRTSLKLDFLNAASVDDRLTAGNFRYFARVMQQADAATWTSTISDDRLCAEVPGCRSRHTCNDHRKAIQDAGYWTFDAGSGRHPTRYILSDQIPEAVKEGLAEKRRAYDERKQAERRNRAVVRRPRKALLRGGAQPSDTVVPTPPVHLILSPYQQARRLQDETQGTHARETLTCSCGQSAIRKRRQRPSSEHPNGTPWQFQCAECADEDDLFPSPLDEIHEVKNGRPSAAATQSSGEAYRRARDGG